MLNEKGMGIIMKIYAYEVREDEKEAFRMLAERHGAEITLSADGASMDNADALEGYDGISMLGMNKIDRPLLTKYRDMGIFYISTRTIGYNHIDIQAARELGIHVCNASYPPNGVADFTVMMILMCLRHYKQAMWRGQVNDFSLAGLQGRDLNRLTVGIMGTGKIGAQVARNLSGFGCRMLAYDVRENEAVKGLAEYVDMDTIFREADIITLHMPLLPETRHIISRESIRKMKDGVILINCARGELTDIDALVEGIETMKIGALGMDTVEGEEGIVHEDRRVDIIPNRNWFYLRQFRNVSMTQHMAFYTREAVDSMVRCGVEGILQMARGDKCDTELT